MTRRTSPSWALLLLAALAACKGGAPAEPSAAAERQEDKPRLGLFTSLPIIWGEAGDIRDFIDSPGRPDWVRTELETRFDLVPLDTLESEALAGLDRILLAQPRPLAPSENVALERFVTNGGTVLIMADPWLTRHSQFGLGDPRRPQDIALLSPILGRLGVEMQFDEAQAEGERWIGEGVERFPVNLSGHFRAGDPLAAKGECDISANGLRAQCTAGEGQAYLFADAAILDWEPAEPVPEERKRAFWTLLEPLLAD